MLTVTELTMRFAGKILFQNSSFQLNGGCHYGLVGANGSGKSTLIKLLAGELEADHGKIETPKDLRLGILRQDHFSFDKERILDVVLMGKPLLWNALQEKEQLLTLPSFSEENCVRLDELEKIIDNQHGYTSESVAQTILEGLGLPSALHSHALHTLSGGYKLRVLLAQVLFSEPDLLLLDEPTNHLDLFSIRWLEDYLQKFGGTIVVSSHDRDFLNRVSTDVIDVDRKNITLYRGNYDDFLAKKEWLMQQQRQAYEKNIAKQGHLQQFVDKFGAKATKAAQAQSRLKAIEKLRCEAEKIDLTDTSRRTPVLHFTQERPSGHKVLAVTSIDKSFGDKRVLCNVTFEIERGDKVAFIGANGIGKTTLLEIITGNMPSDGGVVTWGHATTWGYFPQDHMKHLEPQLSLLEWLSSFDKHAGEPFLRGLLGKLLFSGDDVHKKIAMLSGGEGARLLMAKIMLQKPNVLIFDEPTNHLDIEAIDILMEVLQGYEGTILFVSHNRRFVAGITDRIIEMTGDGTKDLRSGYEEYIRKHDYDLLTAKGCLGATKEVTSQSHQQKGKERFQEQKVLKSQKAKQQRTIERLEKEIHTVEQEISSINKQLSAQGFYEKTTAAAQQRLFDEKQALERRLETLMAAWEHAAIEPSH